MKILLLNGKLKYRDYFKGVYLIAESWENGPVEIHNIYFLLFKLLSVA